MFACLMISLTLGVGAPAGKDAPKKEESIVGEWAGESMVRGGKVRPVPEGGITFKFTADGKLIVNEGNRGEREVGSYKLDSKKNPSEFDLTPPPEKSDKPVLGIYKLDGDTLTLCVSDDDGAARPTKFESPDGTRIMLMTLKRAKKDK
jgi:uncharacterized protein (TIGR03067 family)